VMKNHTMFSYVDQAPDQFYDGNKLTYRSLAGTRRDGTVVLLLSGKGGAMTVPEIAELAKRLEVQHATLLDGGRALQYSLRLKRGSYHFRAFNTELDVGMRSLKPQRSPVYIGIRKKAP
jgi:uncharacterized protein YigE (DUF2233 family)